jgi:putative FmdB family regulatory protein
MPTYEYECTHCGHTFEAFQKITDKPLHRCPKCANKLKKLIGSGSGIIFKGSGFYATDYRKKTKSETVKPKEASCPQGKENCNTCKQR